MSFASAYIEKRILFPQLIGEAPDQNTAIIVVVPSYGEPEICILLDSLYVSEQPECAVEVIILVNAPENASSEMLLNNRKTIEDIESWKRQEKNCWFRLFSVNIEQGAIPDWGVGLARKTGMDEAVRRFLVLDRPDGIIASLDADCTVRKDYFKRLYSDFYKIKGRKACSIYFEHATDGEEYDLNTCRNIISYELHLRYLLQGQSYAGFPWAFHTVGSSMAVRAGEYIAAGGMNRRQAGEDFYFIQKLVDSGCYFSLNSTAVYPSPRISDRVPFGTGAAMGKLTEGSDTEFLTYDTRTFDDLKILFNMVDSLCGCDINNCEQYYNALPSGIKHFIKPDEWIDRINEMNQNTSGLKSFRKRFFRWFNMFKIVKYLNDVHTDMYSKMPVNEAAYGLLNRIGIDFESKVSRDLLFRYREMETGN
jgi:hypothetical protein